MVNFAVIEDNKVTNVIVADTKEIAEMVTGFTCFESTPENPAHVGLGFDGTIFEQPPVTE